MPVLGHHPQPSHLRNPRLLKLNLPTLIKRFLQLQRQNNLLRNRYRILRPSPKAVLRTQVAFRLLTALHPLPTAFCPASGAPLLLSRFLFLRQPHTMLGRRKKILLGWFSEGSLLSLVGLCPEGHRRASSLLKYNHPQEVLLLPVLMNRLLRRIQKPQAKLRLWAGHRFRVEHRPAAKPLLRPEPLLAM